jgi:FtsH-binding integral membrane protein
MSEYNRRATTSPFGQTAGRATVAIDEGLRAYMLHVYNYMVLGLVITGLAALGIYMASVTADPAAAVKILRNGVEVPARVAGNMYLTSIGYMMFVSPVKWVVILAPLAMVFGLSFGIQRVRPNTAQVAVSELLKHFHAPATVVWVVPNRTRRAEVAPRMSDD